jgi:DDE superfamily endonuclease
VETKALAGDKKKARQEGRTIVFIDESGLSERPHRCRTWAPRGQTPVLQYHFDWTWWNFYFRLFPGAIRSPQIIEFLGHLLRHIPGKLLIVWDGLPGHRSRATWEFIREQRGRVSMVALETARVAQLLSTELRAVDLTPEGPCTECASDPTLVIAFWRQAELFPL